MKKILKNDEHIVYVAELSTGEVIGWVHAYIYKLFYADLISEIGGLVVDKDYRKIGVGKELMQ